MINLLRSFLFVVLISASVPTSYGQVSVTQQTAGISPTAQDPTFSAGLDGLSTGSTIVFTALQTGPSPSISRETVTLTGEALSELRASLSTAAAQASGSDFGYVTTTGNQIPGIAATLSGGYNNPAERPDSQITVTASAMQSGNNAPLPAFARSSDAWLKGFLVTSFTVFLATLML
ncbi:uncharacterized protein FA14DRAFT_169621 [Meira miltonrushii]|uniref:Uncharacterized protein n=1 Tax=Meira miltonrushii TaxID=1280837 RepID=A0A316VG87_9BASI|nr:uncharacterized protein FA14DRAFT_169621 [Meira miltonrushii]PWN36647.1 hypothetical protein FA14DRAFT_169621 [Meira miltonrushii]